MASLKLKFEIIKGLILGFALTPVLFFIGTTFIFTPKNTSIYSIETTTYSSDKIKNILDKFNKLGDNSLIDYGLSSRIIVIHDDNLLEKGLYGLAKVGLIRCDLYIDSGLQGEVLREVLLHEFLHCMFYTHTQSMGDLMCEYCPVGLVNEKNYLKYAEDLKRKMYGEREDLQ